MSWLKWIVDKLSNKSTKEITIDEYDVPVMFEPKHKFMDGNGRKKLTKKSHDHKVKRHHEKAVKKSLSAKHTKRVEHASSQFTGSKPSQQQRNVNKLKTQANSKKIEDNKLNRAQKYTQNGQQKRKSQQVNRQKNRQQGKTEHKQRSYAANRHKEQNRR